MLVSAAALSILVPSGIWARRWLRAGLFDVDLSDRNPPRQAAETDIPLQSHLALTADEIGSSLCATFTWGPLQQPCNFDIDVACVVLDYGAVFLRSVHFANKGQAKAGIQHGREQRELRLGADFELLGDEKIELELSELERTAAYLVFVHMIYSPAGSTFNDKVAWCKLHLGTSSGEDIAAAMASDFQVSRDLALFFGTPWEHLGRGGTWRLAIRQSRKMPADAKLWKPCCYCQVAE
mmetsp:Transcript_77114/g.136077  ORF Transcript_77114/g.136077 Transcript_77114/m.136077 type:complete len:237 (-) Transcript_77114:29-739(-)